MNPRPDVEAAAAHVQAQQDLVIAAARDSVKQSGLAIRIGAACLVVLTVSSVATGVGVYVIIDGRSVSRGTQTTIADCLVPGGDCYDKAVANRKAEAAKADRRSAAVGMCLRQKTDRAYVACVRQALPGVDVPVYRPR